MESSVSLAVPSLLKKEIEIKTDIKDNYTVHADPAMINLVLNNLITNAIKFTETRGEIKIMASVANEEIVISVQDNGVGMESTVAEQLFENKFTSVGTDDEQGTGLGLMLSKDLIIINGGRIWVESELNKGSTFYFTLPQMSQGDMKNMDININALLLS